MILYALFKRQCCEERRFSVHYSYTYHLPMPSYVKTYLSRDLLLAAFFIAILGLGGSLYFSEIAGFAPCVLCWFQRIALYPLVPVLFVGSILKDKHVAYYGLPLSLSGLCIAVYHNLLYWKIIPESLAPCVQGVSCTMKYISWFGFITIPFLSGLAFLGISLALFLYIRLNRNSVTA